MEGVDPAITKRLTRRHPGVVVPVLIAVGDPAIRLGEPDNLWRELEQAFESAACRDAPPFEARGCRGSGEQNNCENRNDQTKCEATGEKNFGRVSLAQGAARPHESRVMRCANRCDGNDNSESNQHVTSFSPIDREKNSAAGDECGNG